MIIADCTQYGWEELEAMMGNLQSQPRNETFWFSTTNLHTDADPRTVNIIYMNKAPFLVVKKITL